MGMFQFNGLKDVGVDSVSVDLMVLFCDKFT